MEDFEFSVEISDRDWQCFFSECEECNLLPPSLASVDDSGMSDMDDAGSILAKRLQKVDQTAGLSVVDRPIDGPPDYDGSPVEHYLSKDGIGGMESVLSGSEEDLHLQSVNIFFERLKNVTGAERLAEPSQVRAGKSKEAVQEEEHCSDGKQASSTPLPKTIPKLNSLPARGETAVGKETTEPVDTIGNIMKTMKKDEPGSSVFPEPAASNSQLKTHKSTLPETELLITGEAFTETRVNEATQQSQSRDSPNRFESTPHTDMRSVKIVEMRTPLDDVELEGLSTSHLTISKKCSADLWCNLEMATNVKLKEDQNVSQSDSTSTNKTASQESSPSASIKRKRRKKRRLSAEPAEGVHGNERQGLMKPSDSEEDQYAWRAGTGLRISEDMNLFHLNEPQKNLMSSLTSCSATSNLPVKMSVKEIRVNDLFRYSPPCCSQYQYLPESIVRQGRYKATGSAENNATNNRSVTALSQTDDIVMSASNSSGYLATNIQPYSTLQEEESTGLNKHPGLPVSVTDNLNSKSGKDTETRDCGGKGAHAGSLGQPDETNHSVTDCENERNPESHAAEVKSLTRSILPSAESNDPAVEVRQSDKLSASKSVLAEEAGNSGRGDHALCQREAEPQQQLEMDYQYTPDQYSSTLENTDFPLVANGISNSDAHIAEPKQIKTRACPFLEEIPTQVDCAKLTVDTSNPPTEKCCLSKSLSSLNMNITEQQTEHPLVPDILPKFDVLPEKTLSNGSPFLSGEMNLTCKSHTETKLYMSEDLLTSPSHITPLSSCCTLDIESVTSLSNENITDLSGSSCLSVSQNDSGPQGEQTSLILAKLEQGDDTSGPRSQSVANDTTDLTCDLVLEGQHTVMTASKAEYEPEKAPDSKHSVFAMSSFWSEMEKLTINDILGLRMMNKTTPPSSLPPLQEREETDMFPMTDSGFFTQLDESKSEQTNEDMPTDPNNVELISDSFSSRGIMWQNEPVPVSLGADIYTENMLLTSVGDISQPALSENPQTCLRKICKNVSVHNLHALESFSYKWKGQTLQTRDKGELKKVDCSTNEHMAEQNKDCLASSATDSYRISLTDIFQYLFGGKQSNSSQPATDNVTIHYTDGNSGPESYDHFFSEFDTESFFSPLITAEDQTNDELVPIFSYSRSANRNLQYPEAYDYFFASSSSDDSSQESDEEDDRGPVRVVSRLRRTSSASKISTDTYDNFFTDSDLKQNFFWKNAFSFRNVRFTGATVQKQSPSNSLVPVKPSDRSLRRTIHPVNALGNQDVMFSDPLLYHLEDRISRQLARQPFRYEDLQMAVSNPRLDAPFLPLKQSDMCLVCIAFASWVLKTANPQVGDAWKAVLLANVSALSAIRYLRKYVRMEAAASERKLYLTAPSDS